MIISQIKLFTCQNQLNLCHFFTEVTMQAVFIQRELLNTPFCKNVHSPNFMLHFHSYIEIYAVHSGEIEIVVNDQKKLVGAGEISVVFSYETHGYRTPKEADATYGFVGQGKGQRDDKASACSGRRIGRFGGFAIQQVGEIGD